MLGLLLDDTPRLVTDLAEPVRGPGEALIAVTVAGVCDTDLQLVRGYMNYRGVLGHEFVGEVLEADDARWIGKRVVADINAGCGACDECCLRDGHHCDVRSVLGIFGRNGAIAERLVMPERCLAEVPASLDDERAVFAEPLAAALHVLDVLRPDDERAIVLGDGKLGLLIAMALTQAGVHTTVVGHHADKLALATGAETILEEHVPDDLCAPVVVEATGTAAGLSRAIDLCAARGVLVLKSTVASGHQVDLSPVVVKELSLVGSRCGDMRAAVACLAEGRVDPTPLIAARYPLARAEEALAHADRSGALKVLIDV